MTQYCRYCAFCIDGNALYCTNFDKVLSGEQIRRANHCKDFELSELGDVVTGRQYHPMKLPPAKTLKLDQICIFDKEDI